QSRGRAGLVKGLSVPAADAPLLKCVSHPCDLRIRRSRCGFAALPAAAWPGGGSAMVAMAVAGPLPRQPHGATAALAELAPARREQIVQARVQDLDILLALAAELHRGVAVAGRALKLDAQVMRLGGR